MAKLSFNARMAVRFKKITSDYGKINLYVHETAMEILAHVEEHRNCATAQMLVNAMPQSARKLALINWFAEYSPIVVKDDDKWVPKIRPETDKNYKPFDLENAALNPWFTLADAMGAEKAPFVTADMIKWLETQAAGWDKKAEDSTKVDPDAAVTAKSLAAQLRAIKLEVGVAANDEAGEVPALVEVVAEAA